LLKTLESHTDTVKSVCVTPDGSLIISGSDDKTIKIWNLKTGDVLNTLESHTGYVLSVCVNPDGSFIISGSGDKTIKIWDIYDTSEDINFISLC